MKIDQENSKINYGVLNEEFRVDNSSDEEDMIEQGLNDKKSIRGGNVMSKYERAVRYGHLAKDTTTLGFPNYFTA